MGEVVISSSSSSSGSEEDLEAKTQAQQEAAAVLAKKRRIQEDQQEQEQEQEQEEENDSRRTRRRRRRTSGSNNNENGNGRLLLRWESLLPRMMMRVLLVEADDSTRQIIAALLRKCSYRVAAVPDGLKAWEIIKGQPHNIDLILTEVDLPSISGYALLTLIMEHEICKNIPVIMMSSQDSVATVYKCMLKGAADYLVKPIRRNELRNLWQHVWRRQSSLAGGVGPQYEGVAQDRVEATSENNAASNHSNGDLAAVQGSEKCVEKGSDAQSSCTKPDLQAESSQMEKMHDFLQPVCNKFSSDDNKMQHNEVHQNFGQDLLMCEREIRGVTVVARKDSRTRAIDRDVEQQSRRMSTDMSSVDCDNNDVISTRGAIDFMEASSNHHLSSNHIKSKSQIFPHLDLSLRRSDPTGLEVQVGEERHILRHSDSSAFKRYTNRPLQRLFSTLTRSCNEEEVGPNSVGKLCTNASGYHSFRRDPASSCHRSSVSLGIGKIKESDIATSNGQQRLFPLQIPVKDARFNSLCTGYSSAFPSIFCKQPVPSPILSPSSASPVDSAFKGNLFHQYHFESNSEQLHDQLSQNAKDAGNGTFQTREQKLADRRHISPATDQSASSNFCNGAASHLHGKGYGSTSGSNSNVDQVAIAQAASESKNEESPFAHNAGAHRSILREAALNKFRLKRKERCYEKKVRYESRKKLAEQRPRVKGQFVRQLHIDPPPAETG